MQKNTYLCPYCFTWNKRSSPCYRCINPRCKKKPDLVYAEYARKAPEMKHLCFNGKGRRLFSRNVASFCPECHFESNMLICPNCHNVLPERGKENRTLFISIVGATDAGKSSYLGVFLHEFKRKIACSIGGTASFMDEASQREYEKRFLRYFYPAIGTNPSLRLPKTKSVFDAGVHIGVNHPVLMKYRTGDIEKKRKETTYTFAFYDQAGEDFEEENVMFTMSTQLSWSDAILFFLDPFHIAYIRNRLPSKRVQKGSSRDETGAADPNVILLRLAKVLRAKEEIEEEEKITTPIAVVIPKLDIIAPFLPENSMLFRESIYKKEGAYVCQEGFDIHEELYGLLCEWGEQEFLYNLEANFSRFQLFSLSSLGNDPDEYGRFFYPKPVRVEDPFFWILKEMEVIPSV